MRNKCPCSHDQKEASRRDFTFVAFHEAIYIMPVSAEELSEILFNILTHQLFNVFLNKRCANLKH